MALSCPISVRRVDANLVRAISWQVLFVASLFLVTKETIFAFLLFFDFFVRALRMNRLSPFFWTAHFLLELWKIDPKVCDEAPKRFALYLGLGVSILLNVLHLSGMSHVTIVITVVLGLCAFFEALFEFCIGCKLYYVIELTKRKVLKNDGNIN